MNEKTKEAVNLMKQLEEFRKKWGMGTVAMTSFEEVVGEKQVSVISDTEDGDHWRLSIRGGQLWEL